MQIATDQILLLVGILLSAYPLLAGRGGTFGSVVLQPMPLSSKVGLVFFGVVLITLSLSAQIFRSEKVFDTPLLNGHRIDNCLYINGIACGFEAATTWCRQNGYSISPAWSLDQGVGKTLQLGTMSECEPETCSAFRSITCMR